MILIILQHKYGAQPETIPGLVRRTSSPAYPFREHGYFGPQFLATVPCDKAVLSIASMDGTRVSVEVSERAQIADVKAALNECHEVAHELVHLFASGEEDELQDSQRIESISGALFMVHDPPHDTPQHQVLLEVLHPKPLPKAAPLAIEPSWDSKPSAPAQGQETSGVEVEGGEQEPWAAFRRRSKHYEELLCPAGYRPSATGGGAELRRPTASPGSCFGRYCYSSNEDHRDESGGGDAVLTRAAAGGSLLLKFHSAAGHESHWQWGAGRRYFDGRASWVACVCAAHICERWVSPHHSFDDGPVSWSALQRGQWPSHRVRVQQPTRFVENDLRGTRVGGCG
jgi:hypothetical protein